MYLFWTDVVNKKNWETHLGKCYKKDFLVIPDMKAFWFGSYFMLWKAPDYQLTNEPKPKFETSQQTFLQGRHTDGYKTHEKMLNITHYQRNANQNHNEVLLHASQDGCYPKVYKQ